MIKYSRDSWTNLDDLIGPEKITIEPSKDLVMPPDYAFQTYNYLVLNHSNNKSCLNWVIQKYPNGSVLSNSTKVTQQNRLSISNIKWLHSESLKWKYGSCPKILLTPPSPLKFGSKNRYQLPDTVYKNEYQKSLDFGFDPSPPLDKFGWGCKTCRL